MLGHRAAADDCNAVDAALPDRVLAAAQGGVARAHGITSDNRATIVSCENDNLTSAVRR